MAKQWYETESKTPRQSRRTNVKAETKPLKVSSMRVPVEILEASDAAKFFKVNEYTIWKWVNLGWLECLCDIDKRGRRANVRFLPSHFEQRLINMQNNGVRAVGG